MCGPIADAFALTAARQSRLTGAALPDRRHRGNDPQYIIAAILGLIIITSLGIGGFPPATAVALMLTGAVVIL
jgi:hypothetical protein